MPTTRFRGKATAIFAVFALYVVVFISVQGAHELQEVRQYGILKAQSSNLHQQVEQRLKSYFGGIRALEHMAAHSWSRGDVSDQEYGKLGRFIIAQHPEVLATNFITPEGVISRVYPFKENQAALGKTSQNIQLIKASLARGEPFFFSPPFRLFQGPEGFIYYLPLWRQDKHLGWYAVVLSRDPFRTLFTQGAETFHLQVSDDDSGVIYFSTDGGADAQNPFLRESTFQFSGRKMRLRTWLLVPPSDQITLLFNTIVSLLLTALIAIAWYFYRQRRKMAQRLDGLNQLLRLIVRDAATGLQTIKGQLENWRDNPDLMAREKLLRHMAWLADTIDQVKLVHQFSQDVRDLHRVRTPLLPLVLEISSMLEERLQTKDLELRFDPEQLAAVWAWINPGLFSHGVLYGLLTHLIRQTPPGASLAIEAGVSANRNSWIEVSGTRAKAHDQETPDVELLVARRVCKLLGTEFIHSNTSGEKDVFRVQFGGTRPMAQ